MVKQCPIERKPLFCKGSNNTQQVVNKEVMKLKNNPLYPTAKIVINFNLTISSFITVDYLFKSYNVINNNFDVCAIKNDNLDRKIYFFRKLYFKFYRLC